MFPSIFYIVATVPCIPHLFSALFVLNAKSVVCWTPQFSSKHQLKRSAMFKVMLPSCQFSLHSVVDERNITIYSSERTWRALLTPHIPVGLTGHCLVCLATQFLPCPVLLPFLPTDVDSKHSFNKISFLDLLPTWRCSGNCIWWWKFKAESLVTTTCKASVFMDCFSGSLI